MTGHADDPIVMLPSAIADAEVDLVASVLARPADLVALAEADGVQPSTFEQEDLRLIWCSAVVARDRPRIDVLKLARVALRQADYWDDAGAISNGCRWSNETLARLAGSYLPSAAAVHVNAARLLALRGLWHRTEQLLAEVRDALAAAGREIPDYSSVVPRELPGGTSRKPTCRVTWIGRRFRHAG